MISPVNLEIADDSPDTEHIDYSRPDLDTTYIRGEDRDEQEDIRKDNP